MRIVMMRSPIRVLERGYIGYGWRKVNFAEHDSLASIIHDIQEKYPDGIGRKRKSVARFFNLKAGDWVVVPISNAIVIGQVQGQKSFNLEFANDYAANLVQVNWFKNQDGHLLRISRKELSTALDTYLRIRSSNACLKPFESEISNIIDNIQKHGAYQQQSILLEAIETAEQVFKQKLYAAISEGRNWLAAGGYGLELLLKELLCIEGYEARIEAKNQSSGRADVDIIAIRKDFLTQNCLYIQAKHHQNFSDSTGLSQLIAFDDFEDDAPYQKILITTAVLSEKMAAFAQFNNIQVIDGWQLVDWIYANIDQLSLATQHRLGIVNVPSIAV